MRVLLWHVHGSWTTAFVSGAHDYVVPVNAARDADGLGLARTWSWPRVREVEAGRLRDEDVDVVVLQRPHERELARGWLGRDVPAVYVEHNTPRGDAACTRHPLADGDVPVVHVTHFNALMWDCGSAPVRVVEHGIPDPGHRWTGELERTAVCVNEPLRRGRVTGTDLLPRLAAAMPLDVFGMRTAGLPDALGLTGRITAHDDPPQHVMHAALARHRAYAHPMRWTSLGLSLLEAMHLGVPVVALATTEAVMAVPPDAGVLSTDVDELVEALRWLRDEPAEAERIGKAGRAAALRRYALDRFLADWDRVLEEVTR